MDISTSNLVYTLHVEIESIHFTMVISEFNEFIVIFASERSKLAKIRAIRIPVLDMDYL